MSDWNDPPSPSGQLPPHPPPADPKGFPVVRGPSPSWMPDDQAHAQRSRSWRRPVAVAGVAVVGLILLAAVGSGGGGSSGDDETSHSASRTEAPETTTPSMTTPSTASPSTVRPTLASPTTLYAPAPSAPLGPPPSPEAVPALGVLSAVVVANENEGGYDRERFGYPGIPDGDGCDTRDRVLQQESRSVAQVSYPGCQVIEGDWLSLYDDARVTSPSELEIDHVVALKEAWDSGAWSWSSETLVAFGNDTSDPRTLRAVSTSTNRSKGDKDPSNWMPPARLVWCQYLADWVAIKVRWGLTMDRSEYARIERLLRSDCRDTAIEPIEPTQMSYVPFGFRSGPPAQAS
jgi:hypothetical protein